jgi:hypothetical protein
LAGDSTMTRFFAAIIFDSYFPLINSFYVLQSLHHVPFSRELPEKPSQLQLQQNFRYPRR